jgi:hypothetical protein
MRIYDSEATALGFYQCPDIHAAFATKKKVRRSQSESVSIQKIGIPDREFHRTGRVGCAQRIMRAAEGALTGTYRPLLWRKFSAVSEAYGAAMTATLIFSRHFQSSFLIHRL